MVMSMSVAANAEGGSSPGSDKTCSTISSAVMVKNTFIEIAEGGDVSCEVCTLRRKSAPASPRAALSTVPFDIRFVSTPTEKLGFRTQAWSKISEAADADDNDDWRTESGTTDAEDHDDSYTESETQACSEPGSDGDSSSLVPIALADLLENHFTKVPSRVQLSSKAKAWTPNNCGTSSGFPDRVKIQFAAVLTAAQAALLSCRFVESAQLNERAAGWTLAAVAQSVLPQQVQAIFAAVQRAIIHVAANSSYVYVLGYEKTPFVPTFGYGFSFRLALVPDETTACWDLLTDGFCSRGGSCQHKHPAWQATVNVSLSTRVSLSTHV